MRSVEKIFDGSDSSVFIVAELSANHNGQLDIAIETIRAAKRAGADAIKLQTYRPDTITIDSRKSDFLIKSDTIWDSKYLYDLYEEAHTPWEWHEELFEEARKQDLICFSSPFDNTSVDLLESLGCPIYKIASFEITDIGLIQRVSSLKKPVIFSTGIAKKSDIDLAIQECRNAGNQQIALLKCTSSYPAPIEEANLEMIEEYKKEYNVITGLSDHTMGTFIPSLAVAKGARIIEKHLILNKDVGGPDASFSLDETEFKNMVDSVRNTEKALGRINYELTEKQVKSRDFMRSLYVVEDIKSGEKISESNVRSIRPGFGMHPKYLDELIGLKVNQNLEKGTAMDRKYIEES